MGLIKDCMSTSGLIRAYLTEKNSNSDNTKFDAREELLDCEDSAKELTLDNVDLKDFEKWYRNRVEVTKKRKEAKNAIDDIVSKVDEELCDKVENEDEDSEKYAVACEKEVDMKWLSDEELEALRKRRDEVIARMASIMVEFTSPEIKDKPYGHAGLLIKEYRGLQDVLYSIADTINLNIKKDTIDMATLFSK